ncbi:NECAP-like protein CG9132 [Pollicipes pollicipes]|uniref:NECAP-like protein CG9132 n=1 Tax=Pollicipes pollicipes TaxID=41117 RepID=UPI0018853F27|nr:NECAP-like protein CG9132 [Pollicipes pollicipes]
MEDYESTLLVKQEVFVYQIPPRTSARGYRAADWNLGTPDWTGRMKLTSRGRACTIRLEDRNSGELFANCPIDGYPSVAIEAVTDSSRYFVLRIMDDGGRTAFIGVGFADRSDSFDLNVALQDHFKWVKKEHQIEKEKTEPTQKLDLGFKDGQTIKINMKIARKNQEGGEDEDHSPSHRAKPRGSAGSGAGLGLLPPPPGASIAAPPRPAAAPAPVPAPAAAPAASEWGDFASARSSGPAATTPSNNWVQF